MIKGIFAAAYLQRVFENLPHTITILLIVITSLITLWAFNDGRVFAALLYEPYVIKVRGEWCCTCW